jgi:hypothetical protein
MPGLGEAGIEARRSAVEAAEARVTEVDGRLLTLYRDILKDGAVLESQLFCDCPTDLRDGTDDSGRRAA